MHFFFSFGDTPLHLEVAAEALLLYAPDMTEYRSGSHTVFSVHLHLVWMTKYRGNVLAGDIALRTRALIRAICERHNVEILQGHIAPDHVRLLVSLPLSLTISRLMQLVKGKTAYTLLNEFRQLRRRYRGRHMWERGYFACSTGNVTDEMIRQYIERQPAENEVFSVEGE